MNKTLIVVVLYKPDIQRKTIEIISTIEGALSLPQIDLSTYNNKKYSIDISYLLKTIFTKHVESIDFSWCKPKLLNLEIKNDEDSNIITAIYYGIYIPNNVLIQNGYWVDISEYVAHYDTLRKLVCMM